ncbi:MAG: BppU family phage baseplate upper protein [Clostridia bacterium]|nr:BppU family phage baseplate upper protein [Clostridia bacterium]
MEIKQKINLDFGRDTMPITVFAKQNDNKTRFLEITPLNGGQSYALEEGITPRLQLTKADGHTVLNDAKIENGVIIAELTAQALAAPGVAAAEIGLYKGEELLSSQTFYIDVERAAFDKDAPASSDEYNALVNAFNKIDGAAVTADQAAKDAAAAVEDATEALETAETAAETANGAAEAANTSKAAADAAAKKANTAANNADTATTNADTAAMGARAATDAANTAKTAADAAAGAANTAAGAANTATDNANTATENANKAADAANAAAEAAEGAENVNISAEQTATGATITVTDREGVQTSVHIDTLTAIKTWEDVKNAVRLGLGATLFPVGYEFTTEDSVTGAVITWVVRGHDNHIAANNKLTHTMTLETKYVYGTANGTYRSFVFDATEALYYAAEELPAGTYNFTLLAGYDTTYGGGKTLSFTLTKPVPAGGVIMFPWGYQKQSTDTKISTYASNAATAVIESVAVTESADGTSLGVADGTVENLNHTHRIRYGSNNYAQSAARQWLNSDAAAGGVWAPTTVFDRPPSWNTSYNGFVRGLPADFLAVVQPAAIPCRTSSIFEVNSLDGTEFAINQVYTLKDRFFLLSRPEIYGTWDSATYKDGTLLEFYEGLTDTERIKYDAAGSARFCWLRSPYPGVAYDERSVSTSGALSGNGANNAIGVAPACIIA